MSFLSDPRSSYFRLHRLASEGVDNLLRIEVLRPVRFLLEELPAAVPEQLMVRNLDLERARIPLVVQLRVVRVNEGQLFICSGVNTRLYVMYNELLTRCLGCEDVLREAMRE